MMSLASFLEKSRKYNVIPIYQEEICDIETPVTIYNKVKDNNYSFLLESADKGHFSFIGIKIEKVLKYYPQKLIITDSCNNVLAEKNQSLDLYLEEELEKYKYSIDEKLPPFSGGYVGYFSYEIIEEWEDIYHDQDQSIKRSNLPLTVLVIPGIIISLDHYTHKIKIIKNIYIPKDSTEEELKEIYFLAKDEIKSVLNHVLNNKKTNGFQLKKKDKGTITAPLSNTEKKEYVNMVNKAKEYIKNGDAFQIVLSQKFYHEGKYNPFTIYRALRAMNPSPYLFYLNFNEIKLIGSSPEVLVKVENKQVITRPLAGTRPRGNSKDEDKQLAEDLKNDPKEKAEHIMLVDLGRNDLGRISEIGSVKVTELMGIEYYSKVMHLVSQVEGKLAANKSIIDVLKAVFPAGTVSGAPKIRAMEIIDELEKEARGAYAGAVGYLGFNQNLNTCITIRTIVSSGDRLYIQAGAGIVADSDPEKEYSETLNKARAVLEAIILYGGDDKL